MKRKFLSTLLFGALACTTLSTVTSCKDYDDDINNLQEQIDKKAALDKVNDLITQVSNVETQAKSAYDLAASKASKEDVEAAKTAATDAAKKAAQEIADAATTKANEAAAAAKAAQETADKAVADAAAANKAAEDVAGKLKDYVLASELKTQLEALKTELEEGSIKDLEEKVKGYDNAINALYSAVTEVSLVGSFQGKGLDKYIPMGTSDHTLSVESGIVSNNLKFGEKELDDKNGEHHANTIVEYKKGTQFGFADKLLVRINPVNAVVTKDMIKLVDSKGNDLEGVLEVSSVEKYDDLIYGYGEFTPNDATRAAGNKTGLWLVSFQPKKTVKDINKEVVAGTTESTKSEWNSDKKEWENVHGTTTLRKLYAVAVNNTAAQAETNADAADRYVVSSYDVQVSPKEWTNGGETLHKVEVYSETTMGKKSAIKLSDAKARETVNETTNKHEGTVVPAQSGENVVVDFSGLNGQAEYFYVVRDDKHAGESDASEINAWNAYQYDGLNTIYPASKDGKVTVTIPASAKAGDEICFRVFAVNYDGTYVNKGDGEEAIDTQVSSTGHSFSVYVTSKNTSASVIGNILALEENKAETAWLPITGSISDAGESLIAGKTFTLEVNDEESWTVNAEFAQDAEGKTKATKNSEIKYVKFTSENAMTSWTDGATASLAYQVKENGHQTITDIFNISLTKSLPDVAYTKEKHPLSWKGEQVKNGVFTAYLYSNSNGVAWKADADGTNGYKDMNAVLNGFKGTQYEYVIENAEEVVDQNDNKKYYTGAMTLTGVEQILTVPNKADDKNVALIDNATEHASKIEYNYGNISSQKNANDEYIPHKVTVEEFKTVFACPLAKSAQTYAWKQYDVKDSKGNVIGHKDVNVLVYGKNESPVDENIYLGNYIVATNIFNNVEFGGESFNTKFGAFYKTVDAHLVTNSNGKEDYFTVSVAKDGTNKLSFSVKPLGEGGASNPTADVPSTLKLKLTDCFGHEVEYDLPFTVKRAE